MFRNGTFRSLFLSYVALLIFAVILQSLSSVQTDLKTVRADEERANGQAMEEITQMIETSMMSIERFSDSLNKTAWVHKLYFDLESLDEYYTPQRRREISREFVLYRSDDILTQRMYLIFPQRDILIGANLWTDVRNGLSIIGVPEAEHQAVLDEMKADGGLNHLSRMEESVASSQTIIFGTALEELSAPRAYLCSFIDASRLAASIKALMPSNMASFRIFQGDEVVLSVGQEQTSGQTTVRTVSSDIVSWQYEYTFVRDLSGFGYYEVLHRQFILSVIVVLCGLVAAWALSLFTYRPIRKLMAKMQAYRSPGGRQKEDDYSEISAIYDRIISERDTSKRSHIIRYLLQGYFDLDEANAQMLQYGISFNNVDAFQVYLIEKDRSTAGHIVGVSGVNEMIPILRDVLSGLESLRYELSDMADGKVVLITTSSVREANEMDQKVLACLEQSRQKHGYTVVSGEISHGIIGISLSYQNALDKYIYVHRRIASARYYFPAEWETQLANGLYAGAFQVAERILNETWRENQRRMEAGSLSMTDQLTLLSSLEMTICRTVQEMGLEMPAALAEMEKMNSLEDGWRNMLAACSQICREIAALNTPARDPVVEYVEKHFDDPDMSMDMLSEKFQLSAPTIIKRFKQSTNETFYACLLRLRIERAKELILAGSLTSADIARKIGYESDTSFQRAFKRCVGMSPKEYAASSVKPTEQE